MPNAGKILGLLGSGGLGNGLGAAGLLFSVATFAYGEEKPDATQEAIKGLKRQLNKEDKKLDQIKSLLRDVLNQEKKAQIENGTFSARQRILHLYDNASKALSKEDRGSDDNIKVMADSFIDPTFGYGEEIAQHMTGYLQEIHTILTSDDDTNLFMLAAEHFFEMDTLTLPTSVCERLFRYVDYMRLVQVKGLLGLKFINYPNGVKVNDGKNYPQLSLKVNIMSCGNKSLTFD